mgnify:FL=1
MKSSPSRSDTRGSNAWEQLSHWTAQQHPIIRWPLQVSGRIAFIVAVVLWWFAARYVELQDKPTRHDRTSDRANTSTY